MRRSVHRFGPVTPLIVLVLASACSDDGDALDADAAGSGGADRGGDANSPPNPHGLGPAPVDLGGVDDLAAPGSYVLLAKTAITNATGSAIVGGHVGLSPAAATFITGFSMIADPSNVHATSAVVVAPAKIYASDFEVPTPANLTSAILGMQTAYTDAATRTDADVLDLGGGEIGGETLAPGLYRWGSGVTIPDDLTLAGGADDVWILQVTNDLDLSTATAVTLSGGASAANVFWQVAGAVTIHADAHFAGNIVCQTAVTLQTNATLEGRVLAQTMIALDDNAVTAP